MRWEKIKKRQFDEAALFYDLMIELTQSINLFDYTGTRLSILAIIKQRTLSVVTTKTVTDKVVKRCLLLANQTLLR